MSGPLEDLGFEEYQPPGSQKGGALDDLGFEPADAPAPAEPESLSPLELYARAGEAALNGRDASKEQRRILDGAAMASVAGALPAGKGLSVLGRIGLQSAQGAGMEGLRGALEGDGDFADRAMHALAEAGKGALVGGAVSGGAEAIAGAANKVAPGMQAIGDWLTKRGLLNRVASTGATAPQMQSLAANRGDDYLLELGKAIEANKLHEGPGMLGKVLPQNAETILRNADAMGATAGAQMSAAEAQMRDLGDPIINATPVMDRLNSETASAGALSHPNNVARGDFAQRYADRLASMPHVGQATPLGPLPPAIDELNMPLSNALAEKRDIYNQINWSRRNGVASGPNEEVLGRDVAGIFNREGNAAMDAAVQNGDLPPELVQGWRQANENFGTAQQVADFAQGRAYREQSGPVMQRAGWAAFGPKGIAAATLGQAVRSRGHSALAGAEGAMGGAFGGAGDAMMSFADGMRGTPSGALAGAASDAQRDRINGQSMGHTLESTITQAAQSNPQVLGPYAQRFQEAQQSGDPMRITALIYELEQDPVWRTQYKPALAAAQNQEGR